jgi:hypothetical protein
MEVKKLFVLISSYLIVSGSAEISKIFRNQQTALAVSNSPLYYVYGLLSNWNEKHKEVSDVVVFNIGKKSDLSEKIAKIIPKRNSVTIVDPSQCNQIEKREAAFIIITLDVYDAVSELNGLFFL